MIIECYLFCIEIPETIWRHDIENGGVHTVLDVIDINDALVLLTVFFWVSNYKLQGKNH